MTTQSYDPLGDGISNLSLIDAMGTDQSIVAAARVSTGLDQEHMNAERDAKLIRYLLKHGHWSCFEHCYLTVRVVAPLPSARQWFRHKSWSFNETSRRYTSENVQCYTPDAWRQQSQTNRQASGAPLDEPVGIVASLAYRGGITAALSAYQQLLRQGVAREQARLVLPQAMYTAFYASASLRSAIHFLGLRAAPDAEVEMQRYAETLGAILAARWPVTMAAWRALREAT